MLPGLTLTRVQRCIIENALDDAIDGKLVKDWSAFHVSVSSLIRLVRPLTRKPLTIF